MQMKFLSLQNEVVPVNMRALVIKELEAKWLVDHVCSQPDLVGNVFKEACIIDALENGIASTSSHDETRSRDLFLNIYADFD